MPVGQPHQTTLILGRSFLGARDCIRVGAFAGAISGDRRQAPSPDVSTSLLPHDAALSRRARRAAILGRIGLDLSPRDQPDMACSRVGDFTGGLAVDFTGVVPLRARTTVKLSQMNGNNG